MVYDCTRMLVSVTAFSRRMLTVQLSPSHAYQPASKGVPDRAMYAAKAVLSCTITDTRAVLVTVCQSKSGTTTTSTEIAERNQKQPPIRNTLPILKSDFNNLVSASRKTIIRSVGGDSLISDRVTTAGVNISASRRDHVITFEVAQVHCSGHGEVP